MEKVRLERTGLRVSKLCFGTGRMKNLTEEAGGKLLEEAYKNGVNFWDTADNYNTHKHVKEGLKRVGRKKIVLMSKITNVFGGKVKSHVRKMLKELGTSYIDILLLHAVDSEEELKKYLSIIPKLRGMKEIKHIGMSSHKPKIIEKIVDNPDIEFVLAPLNYKGLRIKGKYNDLNLRIRRRRMRNVLKRCRKTKKDIYLIKILGAGKIRKIEKAIMYGLRQRFSDGIDIGMISKEELNKNLEIVNGS